MTCFEVDLTDSELLLSDFMETGHERGCGPSLYPNQTRVDVSLSLDLEQWLRETAFEYGMTRAELIRFVLRRARAVKTDAKIMTSRHIKHAS